MSQESSQLVISLSLSLHPHDVHVSLSRFMSASIIACVSMHS